MINLTQDLDIYNQGYRQAVLDAMTTVAGVVPYGFELNHDGTEDKERSIYVEGVHDAWNAVGELLK